MENMELEELCEEYRINPYRKHGNELMFYFGEIMALTDKWTDIPFKTNERIIDFAKGMLDSKIICQLPEFNEREHMTDSFTGFVKLDIRKPPVHLGNFFPWIGYLKDGTFRYMQAETAEKNGFILNKKLLFIKDHFAIFANASYDITSPNNPADQYECVIQNTGREASLDLQDNYVADIFQTEYSIKIGINTNKNILTRSPVENLENPLVEIILENKIKYFLRQFSQDSGIFDSLQSMGDFFSAEKIRYNSDLLRILEFNYGTTIDTNSLPTFGDAVKTINYLSSKNKLDISPSQEYCIKTQAV